MALPVIHSSSFDTGDNSEWTSESDTGTKLDFPHYSTIAAIPGGPAPYRGAYCMRIQPGDANDHTLRENSHDIGDGNTAWVRFALFISNDFAATADDVFNIYEWLNASNVVEACISLQITASTDAMDIAIADGTEAGTFTNTISKGVWHVIEALNTVSTSDAGVLTLYVDGAQAQTFTSVDSAAAITYAFLGTQNTETTTDTGYLLFDEVAFDETRLGITHRWAENRIITASSFLFVGSGKVTDITVIDGGSNNVTLELYDTDIYNASLSPIWRGRTLTANLDVNFHLEEPIRFRRGCLALLGGTLPAASFSMKGMTGWGSDGAVKTHASKRIAVAI